MNQNVKRLIDWLRKKGEQRNLIDIAPFMLDQLMAGYLVEMKKDGGKGEYEPKTISSCFGSWVKYFSENNYGHDIQTSPLFQNSRNVLQAKQKELKEKGKGNLPNKSQDLTREDEEKMEFWDVIPLKL